MKKFLLSCLLIIPSAWIFLEFMSPIAGEAFKALMSISPFIIALLFVFAAASCSIIGISFSNLLDSFEDTLEKTLLFFALIFFTAIMFPLLIVKWEVMLYPDKLALLTICLGLSIGILAFLLRIVIWTGVHTLGYAFDKLDS